MHVIAATSCTGLENGRRIVRNHRGRVGQVGNAWPAQRKRFAREIEIFGRLACKTGWRQQEWRLGVGDTDALDEARYKILTFALVVCAKASSWLVRATLLFARFPDEFVRAVASREQARGRRRC